MPFDVHSRSSKLIKFFGDPWYHGALMTLAILLLSLLNGSANMDEHLLFAVLPLPVGYTLWGIGMLMVLSGLLVQNKHFEPGVTLIALGAFLWLFSPKPVFFEAFLLVCYEARTISKKANRLRRFWASLLVIGSIIGFFIVIVLPQYKYSMMEKLYPDTHTWLTNPITLLMMLLGPSLGCISIGFFWQLGLSSKRQAQRLRDLEDKAELAAVRERNRIAREIHDIIAHSLTVMIAQADGGKFAGRKNPDMALQALETIGEVGRKSLGEMRRLLSVLHENSGSERDLGSNPGVAGIDDLIRETRRAGAEVTYRVQGHPLPVSESVGLSIFRIIQESLTNALKHAGPMPITAEIHWDEQKPGVHIRIENELGLGLITDAETPKTNGHGLVGIAERVRLHDGTVSWGTQENAGKWYVDVYLPL